MNDAGSSAPADLPPRIEKLLTALLEQSRDHALLIFSVDQRIIWASRGAEVILGRPMAELVGLAASEMFVAEDVELGLPDQEFEIARSRGSAEDDRWSRRPDGSLFWATGLAYALRDADDKVVGFGKILQNRTDWKLRQETISNRLREVTALDQHKNAMIATLAHELRNPLVPLMNAASMLREGMPNDYPIRLIERQVNFIQRLVDDLLEATRASAGKVELKRSRLLLQDVIQASIETVRPLLERHSHSLDLLTPGPIYIDGDMMRLQQVFTNLLTNAAKYTRDGGKVWIKVTTEDTEAVVRVEDNGIGIAPDMLLHIFELFAQVRTPAHSDGGLGIGLSLVKELVNLHGGSVQANSDGIGTGSVFTVRLPLAPA
jgi:PAS domain S-box-containing protein